MVPQVKRAIEEQIVVPREEAVKVETPPVQEAAKPMQVSPDAQEAASEDFRIVGEVFRCYVIVERGDKLLLIDKHAAHERILFEDLKKKLAGAERASQMMMVPLAPMLTLSDAGSIQTYRAEIEAIGFGLSFKNGRVSVTEIPAELSPMQAEELLMTLAAGLHDATIDPTLARDLLFEKALYQAACKAAIKGGREYPPEYITELCEKLLKIPDITVCPHGRPVAMTLSHANIDRQFHRS